MAIPTKKFWFIFNESGSKTRVSKPAFKLVRHGNYEKAAKEQERLANMFPGEIFILMESISTVTTNNTIRTVLK